MFMRLFQVKVNSTSIEKFRQFYEEEVFPRLHNTDGCIFAGLIKDSTDSNEYISLTFWQTQKNAEDFENSEVYKNLINREKSFFSETNEWKVQLSDKMELEYLPVTEEPVIKKYSVSIQKDDDDKIKLHDPQMYVRIVSMKVQENKLDEFKNIYQNKVIPALKETKGCRHVFLTESINEKDEYISVTIWDSKDAADNYESSGRFNELLEEIRLTFSQFYLWKMSLEKEYSAKVKTSDDVKIETYNIVTGKSFI